MRLRLALAWLTTMLCASLRAADAPRSVPALGAGLRGAGGPAAYVQKKLRTLAASGGGAAPESAASRFVLANAKADRIIEGFAQSARGPQPRRPWRGEAQSVLVEDYHYLSHGRERTLIDIIQGRGDLAARRQERRLRLTTHLRAGAQAIIDQAVCFGVQD